MADEFTMPQGNSLPPENIPVISEEESEKDLNKD